MMVLGAISAVIVQLIIIGCAKPNPVAWTVICVLYHLAWAFGVHVSPIRYFIVLITVLCCFAIKTPVELFLMCMASCFTASVISGVLDSKLLSEEKPKRRWRRSSHVTVIHKNYYRRCQK